MSSKKKMIIAISAFAMVVLAAVVAVVAVLAAQNVTIKSQIGIKYTVDDVVADVAVYAKNVGTKESLTTATNLGTAQTENFGIDYTGTGEALEGFDFDNLAKDQCVVIKFEFNNNSANAFTATLTAPTITEGANIAIYYAADITQLLGSTTTTPAAVSVAAGDTATSSYYAVIKIVDNTKDVDTSVEFNWALA